MRLKIKGVKDKEDNTGQQMKISLKSEYQTAFAVYEIMSLLTIYPEYNSWCQHFNKILQRCTVFIIKSISVETTTAKNITTIGTRTYKLIGGAIIKTIPHKPLLSRSILQFAPNFHAH